MKIGLKYFATVILLISATAFAAASEFSYDVRLRVDPAEQHIAVQATVHHPPDERFYLNDKLTVRRILSGGKRSRYANRYEKTALMFAEASRRFGQDRLGDLLRTFYKQYAGTQNATTALFLEEACRVMGSDARQFFSDCLTHPGWPIPALEQGGSESR